MKKLIAPCSALALAFAPAAFGDNIAAAPGVTIISNSAFGTDGSGNNDGNLTATSMYLPNVADLQQAGFGYDFGGFTTIDSLTISYNNEGFRPRLKTMDIYTSAGVQTVTVDNTYPTQAIPLSPVTTSYVYVRPSDYYKQGDVNIGIAEVAVNSTTNTITPRANLALGKAVTASADWQGTASALTSGNLRQHSPDNSYPGPNPILAYTLSEAGVAGNTGNYVQIDLGSSQSVSTVGIDQGTLYNSDGDGRRDTIHNFTLQFSNDPLFGTILATDSLSLAENTAYEQLDFTPVTAQYVRFHAVDQYTEGTSGSGSAANPTAVVQQIQLFASAVPEPASMGVLGLGALGILARRRRA